MKTLILLSLLSSSIFAQETKIVIPSIVGEYSVQKTIMLSFAKDKNECEENGGAWDNNENSCSLNFSDNASIKNDPKLGYNLHVITFGTNMHHCDFEGYGTYSKNVLTVKDGECVVKAKLSASGNTLSVSANEACRDYCGATAELNIPQLKRK